ncbi:MAG: thiamine pyrophosphate-binding protein [Verrucomicrobiota bacterium]|nr:thiamine pyrophosphate-binding protein [Verrucomicrobiota bacterium]
MKKSVPTIGQFLIDRLYKHGVRHVFGIPGDYVLGFYDQLVHSKIKTINTCDEQGAGFAADAYARVNGLGVVCITYCVGGLKVANTTAQAFAEKSPVVVISGAPGLKEREKNPLLHHKVRDFNTQQKVFKQITVASAVIDDPQTAFSEIDRVLHAALRYKRPVYIEIPRDVVNMKGNPNYRPASSHEESDPVTLKAAVAEAVAMIKKSKKPVILADVEIHRFGLQQEVIDLVFKTNIPIASTLLGKSVVSEGLPQYLGVYEGAMGRDDVRKYVESSDCVIMLGVFMTDINLGIFTAQLDIARSIYATSEKLSIRHHYFEDVRFKDFLRGLLNAKLPKRKVIKLPAKKVVFVPSSKNELTVKSLFYSLNRFLTDDTVVIADVGESLFGAADLVIHKQTEFLATAYYASMGFAVPAALGSQMASPQSRPIVLVGDGAFQMTGMEISSIARYGLNPVIIVLNNSGYGTERQIQDGPYNDLREWHYSKIPDVIGSGKGFIAKTHSEFESALSAALKLKEWSIIDAQISPLDRSPALERLASRLAEKLK